MKIQSIYLKAITVILLLSGYAASSQTVQPMAIDDPIDNTVWYRDNDNDGLGDPFYKAISATKPPGYVANGSDCNDSDPTIRYASNWFRDADQDGFGTSSDKVTACFAPLGYVSNSGDCNDSNADINPDTVWYKDADGDGYAITTKTQCSNPGSGYTRTSKPLGDCNDSNANINPGTVWYKDADGDGYAATTKTQCLSPGSGYTRTSKPLGDCNDSNASINPDTVWYKDADGDGYATTTKTQCSNPGSGYTRTSKPLGDCNDSNANINPGTIWYLDTDGDGYAVSTKTQCSSPGSGYTRTSKPLGDCNDSNANINPVTVWYKDADGDGYAASTKTQCSSPGSGYTSTSRPLGDCDDSDSNINPDTVWYKDADGDGYAASSTTQCSSPGVGYTLVTISLGDCDDSDSNINPDTIWYLDTDGDGYAVSTKTQCSSPGSGYTRTTKPLGDCNDSNASINPDTVWYLDADGDGYAVSSTTQCSSPGLGYTSTSRPLGDCDDSDSGINPDTIWYLDADGDGYAASTTTQCSSPGSGYTSTSKPLGDCDDSDSGINPDTIWYLDADGDGYAVSSMTQCSNPGAGYTSTVRPLGDCDDSDSGINPDTTWYADSDGDGYGDPNASINSCNQPQNFVSNNSDYDDTTTNITDIAPQYFYDDTDDDGFGDPSISVYYSVMPVGFVSNDEDLCPNQYGTHKGCDYNPPTLSEENYIYTRTYQRGMTDSDEIIQNSDVVESIVYYDGLGRPMQSNAIKASPDLTDIITHMGYNSHGVQEKKWLPYNDIGIVGSFRSNNPSGGTISFYETHYPEDVHDEPNPYSQKEYELSPLNRVVMQGSPGYDWRLGGGREIQFEYGSNSYNSGGSLDNVKMFRVSLDRNGNTYTPSLVDSGFYQTDELHKLTTFDENHASGKNHTTEEFTDKLGRVVLKRTYADMDIDGNGIVDASNGETEIPHDTYYVYDDFGNLTYVLPPKMDATTSNIADVENNLDELGYQYVYDYRNRLVEKRIPGKGWEYIVYNKLDQPAMTQDSLQRASGEWLFTKYDAYGRITYTGKSVEMSGGSPAARTIVQDSMDNAVGNQWESRDTNFTMDDITVGYTNTAYPSTTVTEILTVSYYDDYDFLVGETGFAIPSNVFGNIDRPIVNHDNANSNKTKGLPTGSRIKVLDVSPAKWIVTATYYDEKGRAVYTYGKNGYLETTDIVETELDFTGKPIRIRSEHTRNGSTIVTLDNLAYDHVGRLLNQTQCIGDETLGYNCTGVGTLDEELIVYNKHDDLGQLVQKKVGGTPDTNYELTLGLQTVDYAYNVRGWLKQINDPANLGNDLFAFGISYNDPTDFGGNDNPQALYNGNISQVQWSTASTNTSGNPVSERYSYSYDALNRITSAADNTGHYNLVGISYDKNGNIGSLERKGHTAVDGTGQVTSFAGSMDMLEYEYHNSGTSNRLYKVRDYGNDTYGFKDSSVDDQDYWYDGNGNMTKDDNKGITSIIYNHLNLPTNIVTGSGNISYVYDAVGTKLQKTAGSSVTQYAGNYVYSGPSGSETLQFMSQPEGYATPNGMDGYDYVYQYKDHLGNIRLSYVDDGNGGLEIVEESNYYPFGLKHKGYNEVPMSSLGNDVAQKWKYNGKELMDDLGIDLYDYGARFYDAALGKWMTIDQLAEEYYDQSTYTYALNSPIYYIDPDGNQVQACCWDEIVDFVTKVNNGAVKTYNDTAEFLTDVVVNTYENLNAAGDQVLSDVQNFAEDGPSSEMMARYNPLGEFGVKVMSPEDIKAAGSENLFSAKGVADNIVAPIILSKLTGSKNNKKFNGKADTQSVTSKQAFREAKDQNGIPRSQQPDRTYNTTDKNTGENLRTYEFTSSMGEKVQIRKDRPRTYPDGGSQGPHYNAGNSGGKLKQHHNYKEDGSQPN